MKEEFLLIDGYNIIFAWDELKSLAKENLENARIRLLEIMSNYQGFRGINVIVVFDGHLVKGNIGSQYKHNNIHVVFTKEAETADNYIERTVTCMPKSYLVRVATNDNLEQIIILSKGAIRVSTKELYNEIKENERKIRSEYIENRPIKSNLLCDCLDEKTRLWIENLRMNKD